MVLAIAGIVVGAIYIDKNPEILKRTTETSQLPTTTQQSEHTDQMQMDEDVFMYINDLFSMSISIQKLFESGWGSFPMEPFIQVTDSGHKYGLTDPSPLPTLNRYRFTLDSSRPIHELGPMNYLINLTHDSNCFDDPFKDCPTNDRRLVFEDVCENFRFEYLGEENHTCTADDFYNENELCLVLFNPQCEFTETDNGLQIEFSSPITDSGNILIDPQISFTPAVVEGIEMDVIDRDQYIIIWCDETADDTTFAVYYTNGTVITSAKDIDTSNGGCTSGSDYVVDIIVLDTEKTTAAAVWPGNGTLSKTATFNYTSNDNITIISFGSRTNAVTLTRLDNSKYAIAFINGIQQDATTIVFNETPANITGEFVFDSAVGDSRAIASTSFTNDNANFSVIWFDNNASNIKFTTLNLNGTFTGEITQEISDVIVDGVTEGTGTVSIDSFDATRLVVGWLQHTPFTQNIRFSTYFKNGTVITAPTSIEGSVGVSTSVSVSTLNTIDFAESWDDPGDGQTDFEIWNITGGQLVDKIVAFDENNFGAQEILSTNSQDFICFDRLILASTVAFGIFNLGGQTKTFLPNGTLWDSGFCETCDYETGQGNFNCLCDENATLDHNVIIDAGHNISFTRTGTFTTSYNISNWDKLFQKASCYVRTNAGGGFIE